MQINNFQSNLSFKKALQARCTVISNDKEQIPSFIYKLEPGKDKNYFSKIKNKNDWQGAQHFNMIAINNTFLKKNSPFSIYTMESLNGDCLGIAEVCDFDDEVEILSMESAPMLTSYLNKSKSGLKYIGENFVAFFVKLAKKSFKPSVNIESYSSSLHYYTDKCKFRNYLGNPIIEDEPLKLYMPQNEFVNFLEMNKEHTKTGVVLTN